MNQVRIESQLDSVLEPTQEQWGQRQPTIGHLLRRLATVNNESDAALDDWCKRNLSGGARFDRW